MVTVDDLADSPEHGFTPQDRLPDRCGFISDGMLCGYDRKCHEALWPREPAAPDDLADFLAARYDEAEALARDSGGGWWGWGWPAEDAPGRYEITCSCGRWTFAGTAPEIAAASRRHDDSPRRNHVVVVMHGGRRIDRPDLEEMTEPTGKVLPPASPKPWDGGFA